MKVGRVAIITRGRYAGKKVRLQHSFPAIEMHMSWVTAENRAKEKEKEKTNEDQRGSTLKIRQHRNR
jgi:hypothetical protein